MSKKFILIVLFAFVLLNCTAQEKKEEAKIKILQIVCNISSSTFHYEIEVVYNNTTVILPFTFSNVPNDIVGIIIEKKYKLKAMVTYNSKDNEVIYVILDMFPSKIKRNYPEIKYITHLMEGITI
jgi:hypothetical protein